MSRLSASRRQCACALLGALLGVTPALRAEEGVGSGVFDTIEQGVQTLFQKCRSAVVRIEAMDSHGHLSGTGFFVDPNGTLYTSWGVGGEARDFVVCTGDAKYMAKRLISDSRAGIAILKVDIDRPVPFLPIGSVQDLGVGSPIMTIGYPMDLPATPSFGMVGGFDIKHLGRFFGTKHIRANVAVQRGEGGAPLLNMKGEAVGILISSLDQGSASFVLPIEAAEKVRRDYVRFGEVRTGWIGVIVGEAKAAEHGSVAEVQEVMPETPAQKAGLQTGDILLQLGSKAVTSPEDMLDASYFLSAGDSVPVKVAREGEAIELSIQPAENPNQRRPLLVPSMDSVGRPNLENPLQFGSGEEASKEKEN
ncbi:MAG: serine protease [Verrucomicrobiaceae bacterium]|nr:MAG: serine protease [Verrucomicrobiaceae bacterium]